MLRFVSIVLLAAVAIGYYIYSGNSFLKSEQITTVEDKESKLDTNAPPNPLPSIDNKNNEQATVVNTSTENLSVQQKQAAKEHIKNITVSPDKPIPIKTADHFVTADQILELPELKEQTAKIENLDQKSENLASNLDITNDVESPSLETINTNENAQSFAVTIPSFTKKLDATNTIPPANDSKIDEINVIEATPTAQIKESQTSTQESGSNPTENILGTVTAILPESESTTLQTNTTLSNGNTSAITTKSINTIIVTNNIEDDATINSEESQSVIDTITKNIETLSDNTVQIFSDEKAVTNQTIKVVEKNTTIEEQPDDTNTVAKVNNSVKNNIQLREILSDTEDNKNKIFYLHAVNSADEQGIWGIIQKGLINTFSKGINLQESNNTLKAIIPEDADELLSSKRSSFLGKLLNDKVLTTYVYNYEKGNIGKNPDYIKPGQQLIIVTFSEQELLSVFQHFNQ